MTKQQRKTLFTYIFLWISITFLSISFFGFIIGNIVIKNNEYILAILNIIFFISMIIGLISLLILGHINVMYSARLYKHIYIPLGSYAFKGVPNNSKKEFYISPNLLHDELVFEEKEKGIFMVNIDEKDYVFDMRGWYRKIDYICDILLCTMQIYYCFDKLKIYKSCSTPFSNLHIIFKRINGKKITKIIVEEYKTIIPRRLKRDIKQKLNIIKIRNNKSNNRHEKLKKIPIDLLYDFN